MTSRLNFEQTKFWRAEDIGDLDLLKATYVTHTFSRHIHEGYVIGVIERGAEAFYYRGATHVAPAGSIVVIDPGEVHTGQAVDKAGWTYRTLYPEIGLLQQVTTDLTGQTGQVPHFPNPVLWNPSLANLLRRLHIALEASPNLLERETLFHTTLAYLITWYARNCSPLAPVGHEPQAVGQVLSYLEDNYAENISLQHLADLVNFSPYYIARVFRRHVGLPPHAYLTQLRINRAKTLLIKGSSISQVATETGFVDQSHLTRHFKRIVGVTPAQYRP